MAVDEKRIVDPEDIQEMTSKSRPKKEKKHKPKARFIQHILKDPASFVNSLVTKTETVMEDRASSWRRYRAKYRIGLQYGKRVGDMALFIANDIFSNVETVKANIGNRMPFVSLDDPGVDDIQQLDMLSKLVWTSLIRGGLQEAQKKVVHHGAICGHAFFKLIFDPEAADGEGDNLVECIAPEDCLVDPLAVPFWDKDGRTRARYIIHRRRDVPTDEIEATYGVSMLDDEEQEVEDITGVNLDPNSGISSSSVRTKPFGDPQNTMGRTYDVYECWLQTYEKFEEDEEGNVISSPWYVITVAGNKVLDEKYSPYKHGRAPFYPWFDVADDGAYDFYHIGVGEVEEIEMIQDKNSILDLNIFRNIRQTVNRQRVVNRLMGITKDDVDNKEGRVYEVSGDPRLAMMWDSPPQLGTDVYTYRMQGNLTIQKVSGVTDSQSGVKPTGIAAGKAIVALQNASEVRIEDKRKSLVDTEKFLVLDALENIFQFYDTERIVRLVGGPSLTVVGDYPPELQPGYQMPVQPAIPQAEVGLDEGGVAPVEPFAAMPEPEMMTLEEGPELDQLRLQWKQMNGIDLVLSDVKLKYDVTVSHGSAFPENKAEALQMAADFFRLNAIDRQALLEIAEFPNRAEIIARMGNQTSAQAGAVPGAGGAGGMDPMMLMQMLMGMGGGGMPPGGNPMGGGMPPV